MNTFLKASATVIIALLLSLILSRHNIGFTVMIAIILCCAIFHSAVDYLQPVFNLTQRLSRMSEMDNDIYSILLKSVGISFLSEIVNVICADAGYNALGKSLQILSNIVILWLSVPLLNGLIEIVEKALGAR